ncbi:glycosyltransferase [Croceicoccus ponticola]|uniref:Glycosyltransferase n=1 Tax=Croceicoccus ponticola TaxID=2217664 RepID=A0A437GY86_9SPHN|nr:glycosyltransferase [Croceicoccus ponticola]RVQ67628.1 glycosyltransferase [Croceicoccus ponticola]
MRIALLTRSYPSEDNLYQYPFVHRRVVAYLAAGHAVKVIRLGATTGQHSFDGVECHTVTLADFAAAVTGFSPDVVAVHGPDESIWPALRSLYGKWPVCGWLHGSEIPDFFRAKANCRPHDERDGALAAVEHRAAFWRETLAPWPDELSLTFVSECSIGMMERDLAPSTLQRDRIAVIPNPIDTSLFVHHAKTAAHRYRILSIRPYDAVTYGNDMAVKAVHLLSRRPDFSAMRFTFVGDGPLFDDTLAPLRQFANVTIERRFLRQQEIARMHRDHGMFLVPTRLDTQGVSRDEAMASGLVPITNTVCAVPEYVDADCAGLAGADDAAGLADQIARMIDNPALFLARSTAAAARVRSQSGHEIVIPRELAWLDHCRQLVV